MFNFIKKLFGFDQATMKEAGVQIEQQAPYKIETPEPAKCGCGRSPTGFCVGLHSLSKETWDAHPDNPNKVEAPVNPQITDAVTQEAPAKKERKPRTPKAEKPAVEKAAKPKKPAAITAKKPGRKPKAK